MTSLSTRERILAALADEVTAGNLSDFSVQGVADRCGVSHRTVYRYFPTRESLLEGLVEQMSAAMEAAGGPARVEQADELPEAINANFALFTAHADLAEAAVRFSVGTATENRDRRTRTDAITAAVEALGPTGDDARLVSAVLRHLGSSRTWLLLRELGLDADDTAAAAAWAARILLTAIDDGEVPSAVVPPTTEPESARPERAAP